MNSKSFPRSEKISKVICTNIDNNALLGVFKQLNIAITDIVIIRDGCCEGGNYECCASNTFLGKIVGIQNSPFNAYSCHCFSDNFNLPAEIETVEPPEYVQMLRSFSDPIDEQKGIKISARTYNKKEFQVGQIKVGLLQESICRRLENYDVVLLPSSRALLKSLHRFVEGQGLAHQELFYPIGNDPDASFAGFLEAAQSQEWQKIAALPFGKRRYKGVLSAIEDHKGSNLQKIDFYHLHNSDYRQIYKMSRGKALKLFGSAKEGLLQTQRYPPP
ncbi:MAG: hypothetical protein KKB51_12650 [Candidatus Riflebacteria bacterium]|nr:hypothetical protein [Candidatus Riflebacteria bacterium]